MATKLPENILDFMTWTWDQIEPCYAELERLTLEEANITEWLQDWSNLAEYIYERQQRLFVSITSHTDDPARQAEYETFLDQILIPAETAEQHLKDKLLASRLEPRGFTIPLRNLRTEAKLFQTANLPLLAQELKLSSQYDQIIGKQIVLWQGQETTLLQLQAVYREPDRGLREQAWRIAAERWLQDRDALNSLWTNLLELRRQIAQNAGLPDYRAYRWKKSLRFDYSPEDCLRFHEAIEKVAVPVASLLYEKRRTRLGLESLRPWDLNADLSGQQPLRPFKQAVELEIGCQRIFDQVDPQLGQYFKIMRQEGLLDLLNRKNKASGGYCTEFPASDRPFILMNAVGIHEDVQTLLHEGGHAFHVFETNHLPLFQQKRVSLEFAEVASMGMELLSAPYLVRDQGGFYSTQEAARARLEYLEDVLRFWPYMAVVDAFQHWAYTHPQQAQDPDNCDAQWAALWTRFMPGEDWSGLETECITGWQRKSHIFQDPFYYIEYGLALLGAFQVWRNAIQDQSQAVAAYRRALALGGTVSLPELYSAAGARLAFDAEALQDAIDLGMQTIAELEQELA